MIHPKTLIKFAERNYKIGYKQAEKEIQKKDKELKESIIAGQKLAFYNGRKQAEKEILNAIKQGKYNDEIYEQGYLDAEKETAEKVQKLKEEIKENCELEINENGLIMIIDKIFNGGKTA